MSPILIIAALLAFTYLAWKNYARALAVFFALLPTYLIRFHLGPLPTTFLESLTWILIVLWLMHLWRERHKIQDTRYKTRSFISSHWLFAAIALFLLGATINVFLATDVRAALGEWRAFYVEPVIIFYLLVTTIKTKKGVQEILFGLILSGLVTSGLAIYQHFTGWLVPHSFWANRATYRVTAWYGFPNAVGLWLAPLVPIAVYLLHTERDVPTRRSISYLLSPISIISIIAALAAIIFAKSTGALVGLAAGIGAALLLYKKTRWWAVGAGVAAVIMVSLLPTQNPLKQELLAQDYSGQIRREMWSETVDYLKLHPLRGAGLASYTNEITPFRHNRKIEVFHHPHNIFLTMWVNTGLIGLIGFLGIVGWFLLTGMKRPLGPGRGQDIRIKIMLVTTMVVWLTMGLVDSPYIKNDLAMFFWLLIALPLCLPGKPLDSKN